MKKESLLEIYIGNKLIERHFPVMIVAAETSVKWNPIGEHIIFTGMQQLPLLRGRQEVSSEDDMHDGTQHAKYPHVFSARAVFNRQFQTAQCHLQTELAKLDKSLHRELFWNGRPFEFQKTDKAPLLEWQIEGLYEREFKMINREIDIEPVRSLCKELFGLPKFKIKRIYPGQT